MHHPLPHFVVGEGRVRVLVRFKQPIRGRALGLRHPPHFASRSTGASELRFAFSGCRRGLLSPSPTFASSSGARHEPRWPAEGMKPPYIL